MARCKTVWFTESEPTLWFEKMSDAELYDHKREIADYVKAGKGIGFNNLSCIIDRILERYEIKQRWDWKAPDQDEQK